MKGKRSKKRKLNWKKLFICGFLSGVIVYFIFQLFFNLTKTENNQQLNKTGIIEQEPKSEPISFLRLTSISLIISLSILLDLNIYIFHPGI